MNKCVATVKSSICTRMEINCIQYCISAWKPHFVHQHEINPGSLIMPAAAHYKNSFEQQPKIRKLSKPQKTLNLGIRLLNLTTQCRSYHCAWNRSTVLFAVSNLYDSVLTC
jgi:hypothetical protein